MEEINILDSRMRSYSYLSGEITIGRSSKNDLCLPDGSVSRRHAVIKKRNGDYIIQDLGSSNGTIVNGEKIKERVIGPNDVVKIGKTILFFRTTKEEAKKKIAQMKEAARSKSTNLPEDENTVQSGMNEDEPEE